MCTKRGRRKGLSGLRDQEQREQEGTEPKQLSYIGIREAGGRKVKLRPGLES